MLYFLSFDILFLFDSNQFNSILRNNDCILEIFILECGTPSQFYL